MDMKQPSLASRTPLGIVSVVLTGFLLAVDAIALGIRLRSRRIQRLPLCLNDYAALLAWVRITMRFDLCT